MKPTGGTPYPDELTCYPDKPLSGSVTGRVVIVTTPGGLGRLAELAAMSLEKAGARVVLADQDFAKLERRVVDQLAKACSLPPEMLKECAVKAPKHKQKHRGKRRREW